MSITTEDDISPAERKFGYPFGVDGVVGRKQAEHLLACHTATLYRLCKRGMIRRGRLGSRARFCRRSIGDYLRTLEV